MIKKEFDRLWSIVFGAGTADNVAKYIIQDETELWELCQRLDKLNPQKGLEIGNASGGTTLFWQALAPLVVSIDLYEAGSADGVFPVEMLDDVKFILGDSHSSEILEQAKEFAPYDFLFIDGDHTIEGVKMDYDMYAPLVKKGGIVAFHDWGYQEGAPSHRWPIRECIASTSITPEIIQHSHFGIAVLYME
jgi:predicted O-methyltransferase YrrM